MEFGPTVQVFESVRWRQSIRSNYDRSQRLMAAR